MRGFFLVAALVGACSASVAQLPRRNYDTHSFYVVHLDPSVVPAEFAEHLGLEHDGPFTAVEGHHIFRATKHDGDVVESAIADLRRRRMKRDVGSESSVLDGVKFTQKQVPRRRLMKRSVPPSLQLSKRAPQGTVVDSGSAELEQAISALNINDPLFPDQWHLVNVDTPSHDINVTGVWEQGITGDGVVVCVVDDGLDMNSRDLRDNFFADGSYDFNADTSLPRPTYDTDTHGTRCAGEIAAGKNSACGLGVAYDAKISGVRILSEAIADVDEAQAINYEMQKNHIYSNSWGPTDDGMTMDAPGALIQGAIENAIENGRGGKGSIYVFAAGNGADMGDACNFDGYANSIYTITVGAITDQDEMPYYSEGCSALMMVAYSSGGVSSGGIRTTDVGTNQCTSEHGGTSAAGPLASGVFALVLSIRPDLTWRDMQWISAMSAVPFRSVPNDWQDTALGLRFSHQFGYGKLDAGATVELAKNWTNVKRQSTYESDLVQVGEVIPQNNQGVSSTITITEDDLQNANFERIEQLTVTMNVDHTRRGDISVQLVSPSGITSLLATPRSLDDAPVGYIDWKFMSLAHWGESGVGDWTVTVFDTRNRNFQGSFLDWRLKLYGECIDEERDDNNNGGGGGGGGGGNRPDPTSSASPTGTGSNSANSAVSLSAPQWLGPCVIVAMLALHLN